MKDTFLSKNQDYCQTKNLKEEIFRIPQKEEESFKDYMELLHYNLQSFKFGYLDLEILKKIYLRGMRDDFLEHFNLLGKGNISKELFEEIMKLRLWSSGGSIKGRSSVRDPSVWIQKSTSGGVMEQRSGIYLRILKLISSVLYLPILPRQKLRKHKEKM